MRNIDEALVAKLKKKAKSAGKSRHDFARELRVAASPSKEKARTEVERIITKIGKLSDDSTAIIRDWRSLAARLISPSELASRSRRARDRTSRPNLIAERKRCALIKADVANAVARCAKGIEFRAL